MKRKMGMNRLWTSLAFVFAMLIRSAFLFGQSDSNAYTPEMLQRYFVGEAKSYEILDAKKGTKLKWVEEPLLNWQNTERLLEKGAVFLWRDGSRPAMIASVFTYQLNNQIFCRHEMISLTRNPLKASLSATPVWAPEGTEEKRMEVAQDLLPASTEVRRLTQMRGIMRQCSGQMFIKDANITELRLMTQPLFRYQVDEEGIVDGALFAFAVGTDPEILVLIEAVKKGQNSKWFVTPFRSHYERLQLSYLGKQIWKVDAIPELASTKHMQVPFAKKPFFVFTPPKRLPAAELLK